MQVGETVSVMTDVWDPQNMTSEKRLRKATVVYIHPDMRYYVVEYANGIRESFFPTIVEIDAKPRSGFHTKKKK